MIIIGRNGTGATGYTDGWPQNTDKTIPTASFTTAKRSKSSKSTSKKVLSNGHVAYRIRALLASIRDLTMSNYCLQPIIPPTYEKTSRRLVSSNIGHRIESYD